MLVLTRRPFIVRPDTFYPVHQGRVVLPDMALKYRHRTFMLEAQLRARLAAKGFVRGLQGTGIGHVTRLYGTAQWGDGRVEHVGLMDTRVVTDAGVALWPDNWDGSLTNIQTINYHGVGTGTTAADATQTALVTEATTQTSPASTRQAGTKSQPGANICRSVATTTFASAIAVTEWGIFTQAAVAGGTMYDRKTFGAMNFNTPDTFTWTWDYTISSGG
jgi:hypothetical protein